MMFRRRRVCVVALAEGGEVPEVEAVVLRVVTEVARRRSPPYRMRPLVRLRGPRMPDSLVRITGVVGVGGGGGFIRIRGVVGRVCCALSRCED